ncbi:MAG: hypothetical protein PUH99_06790, partial [Firmicutes bacterium]|nr:hypothetical protein [Bacillota bacterium]MDY5531694.1 hypothetical protein [Pumilibacteraceae bacterium]
LDNSQASVLLFCKKVSKKLLSQGAFGGTPLKPRPTGEVAAIADGEGNKYAHGQPTGACSYKGLQTV